MSDGGKLMVVDQNQEEKMESSHFTHQNIFQRQGGVKEGDMYREGGRLECERGKRMEEVLGPERRRNASERS